MIQKTFVMIRPDGIEHKLKIEEIISRLGKITEKHNYKKTPRRVVEELYREHKESFYYYWLVKYHAGKETEGWIVEGEDIVKKVRSILGDKSPKTADKGTIRGLLSNDDLKQAISEKRMVRNVAHASLFQEEVEREITIYFP